MGHVVAIAHVGQGQARQLAEFFLQGLVVGQGLAGVLQVREGIHDRDRGPMGVVLELGLGEGANRQGVHITAQHPGGIGYRFTPAHLGDLGVEINGLAP